MEYAFWECQCMTNMAILLIILLLWLYGPFKFNFVSLTIPAHSRRLKTVKQD
jgi:hypothetical protein